jgi:hypothetical protein
MGLAHGLIGLLARSAASDGSGALVVAASPKVTVCSRTLRIALRLKFNKPQDNAAVAFTWSPYGPQSVNDGRLDLDEALAALPLHGPPRGALRQRRGDRVKGGLGEGDANHRRERDSYQTVISGLKFDETKPDKKARKASHAKTPGL